MSRNRLERALRTLGIPAVIVRNWEEADFVLTLRGQEKKRTSFFERMRQRNVPVYSIRSNTVTQIRQFLERHFRGPRMRQEEFALREAEVAIRKVQASGRPADLTPQSRELRRLQHLLAQQHSLRSTSRGAEPHRYVRIYK